VLQGKAVYNTIYDWAEIRRRALVEGHSKRAARREFQIYWSTLDKILALDEPPGYQEARPRVKPKLGSALSWTRSTGSLRPSARAAKAKSYRHSQLPLAPERVRLSERPERRRPPARGSVRAREVQGRHKLDAKEGMAWIYK